MFNTLAFKEFVTALLDVVDDKDMHGKLSFLHNMLDDETVLQSLRTEWTSNRKSLLELVDDVESSVTRDNAVYSMKLAGYPLSVWLQQLSLKNKHVFVLHVRSVLGKTNKIMKYPSDYEDMSEEPMNIENALSEIQNSDALKNMLSGAEKIARDVQSGKQLDLSSMMGEVMSAMNSIKQK